jgi:sec-independent protein translocase protein TatA
MFGISGEHLLILGIVLLIFGPRRLPELGNTLGKAIRNFKDAVSGVEEANFRKIDESEKKKPEAITQANATETPVPNLNSSTSAAPAPVSPNQS